MCFISKPKTPPPVVVPPAPTAPEVKDQSVASPSTSARRKSVGIVDLRIPRTTTGTALSAGGIKLPTI